MSSEHTEFGQISSVSRDVEASPNFEICDRDISMDVYVASTQYFWQLNTKRSKCFKVGKTSIFSWVFSMPVEIALQTFVNEHTLNMKN